MQMRCKRLRLHLGEQHEAMLESRAAQKSESPKHDLGESDGTWQQLRICIVCQKAAVEIIFHPCGHRASCIKCAKVSSECPLCHDKYTGLCRVYMDNFKHDVDMQMWNAFGMPLE